MRPRKLLAERFHGYFPSLEGGDKGEGEGLPADEQLMRSFEQQVEVTALPNLIGLG